MTPEQVRDEILKMASRQEEFAGPEYTQCTDADRQMFRHAANMLRVAAELVKKIDKGAL